MDDRGSSSQLKRILNSNLIVTVFIQRVRGRDLGTSTRFETDDAAGEYLADLEVRGSSVSRSAVLNVLSSLAGGPEYISMYSNLYEALRDRL